MRPRQQKEKTMKQIRLAGYALIALIGIGQLKADSFQRINLLEITEQTIQDFSEGKLKDFIVECPEGARLPLNMALKGEFLSLEPASTPPLHLKVLKSFYIRCEEKELFLF